MCGRFSFAVTTRIIEERFSVKADEQYQPRYNCAPSQYLAVISNVQPQVLSFFRWGLIPFWAKEVSAGNRLINAKAETITQKTSFRNPFRNQRCLVLCDSFYEWTRDKEKTPYRFLMKNEEPFVMAGIWNTWTSPRGEKINSFSIITTYANACVVPVHHRMPVILKREHEKIWLEDNEEATLLSLLMPYPAEEMKCYPVTKLVNSPANDDIRIWQPAGNYNTLI